MDFVQNMLQVSVYKVSKITNGGKPEHLELCQIMKVSTFLMEFLNHINTSYHHIQNMFNVVRDPMEISLLFGSFLGLSQISAQQIQGGLKVIGVFLGGLASNLELVIAMEHRSSSRSSQGHLGIYYWIGFKLSTWDHN